MNAKLLLLLSCLWLGACAVGEDYTLPKLDLSDSWEALTGPDSHPTPQVVETDAKKPTVTTAPPHIDEEPVATIGWWERFNDPQLSALMDKARLNNNDLKVALTRIAEAQGNARVSGAALLPQINGTASIARTGALRTTATPPDTVRQFGLSGAWDIDIFGGDRRSIEAAIAEVQATEADHDRVLLTLVTDVATNYVQLRSLQQQRILTANNLAMQRETLKVTEGQRAEGAISDLEVARAKAQVDGTAARLPQIDTAAVAALNRLSVLTGEAPNNLDPALTIPQPIPGVPTDVVVATPVAAIEHRPDVRAAERRLAEATALTGAAIAQLYPKITLQGFFGGQFSQVYGYSAPINASASLLTPLLDWGRIHGQIDTADAKQQEAFFTYQQTILLALEQIENALTAYLNEQQRNTLLVAAAQEQRKAAEVAEAQYKVGATTQLDLLTAEDNRLEAESELTQSQAALGTDLIQLYSVLGETWQPTLALPPEPPIEIPAPPAKPVVVPARPLPPVQLPPAKQETWWDVAATDLF